jgi:hypothetical protein
MLWAVLLPLLAAIRGNLQGKLVFDAGVDGLAV